jgi:hypothetical protein
MGSIPFAISIHKFVSSTGADAGFAALIGLAILILLYFAQARETATLREQAAEAGERAEQLEQRVAELARELAAHAPEPAPAVVKPAAAAAVGRATARPRIHLGPPAGVAAPALAAATRLIPLPTDNGVAEAVEWPGEPIKVHRAATEAPAPPSTVAGGNGHSRVPPVAAPPPRRRLEPAPGGAGSRQAAGSRRPILPPQPPPRRRSRVLTVLLALLGVLVIAAVAVVLVAHFNKSSSTSSTAASRTTNASGTRQPVSFNPRSVTVAVLNGTGTTGLAHRTAVRLSGAGYRQGTVATATDQTRTTTQVAFLPGYRTDAARVASTLKLPSGSVQPIDPGTRAVACPPPAACTTNVVVTVGSDLATTG